MDFPRPDLLFFAPDPAPDPLLIAGRARGRAEPAPAGGPALARDGGRLLSGARGR